MSNDSFFCNWSENVETICCCTASLAYSVVSLFNLAAQVFQLVTYISTSRKLLGPLESFSLADYFLSSCWSRLRQKLLLLVALFQLNIANSFCTEHGSKCADVKVNFYARNQFQTTGTVPPNPQNSCLIELLGLCVLSPGICYRMEHCKKHSPVLLRVLSSLLFDLQIFKNIAASGALSTHNSFLDRFDRNWNLYAIYAPYFHGNSWCPVEAWCRSAFIISLKG